MHDSPVKVGSMLLTLVDPERGHERAYNRWYERDHFYAGCLIGPYLFAGARWVATRALKSLRWPRESAIAEPFDAGSFLATYWVLAGHHDDHFEAWARPQVRELYAAGRGFAKRTHVHTALFDHLGASYRDADPVPIELALDRLGRLVALWLNGIGRDARTLARSRARLVPQLLAASNVEIASSWTPCAGENEPKNVPMHLGSPAGGPERLCQLFFVTGDVRAPLERFRSYTQTIERASRASAVRRCCTCRARTIRGGAVVKTTEVSANGFRFTADVAGDAGAPLVLLLHGFPQTRYTWRHQLPALAAAGYRAVAPDQRGYSPGARPSGVEHYGIDALLGDALAIADACGAQRFHLVGHDWGGQLAWLLAARHLSACARWRCSRARTRQRLRARSRAIPSRASARSITVRSRTRTRRRC
jgi:hypothetical protein